MKTMNHLYPVNLRLAGKKCVVVGGGEVASRKVASLLECGAKVTLISPAVVPGLAELIDQNKIECLCRPYQPGDLAGAFLVIGATDDEQVNRQVASEAQEQGILVNAVDDPPYCSFYVPAVIRRGPLCISISTTGTSPWLARKLREELAEQYGPEYGVLLEIMGEARAEVLRRVADPGLRRRIFKELGELELLAVIRDGGEDLAKERVAQCILSLLD